MHVKRTEIKEQLDRIMSFWVNMKDEINGGFFCRMDFNLKVDRFADKSGVATARNLWSFSRAYTITNNKKHLECANHAYAFLIRNFIDREYGGAYWQVDNEGSVVDDRKHIYLQAFCIYALSEYYKATGNGKALQVAMKLMEIVEDKGWNPEKNCYKEEFLRDWVEVDNELLSENGIVASITTNTHLHLLEAYTSLYKAVPTGLVRKRLQRLIDIFYDQIYLQDEKRQMIFFDGDWNEIIDLQSYGHDIEASWLIDKALKALSNKDKKYYEMVIGLAEQPLKTAIMPDGSMINECEDGSTDDTRLWWVQAEAAVGFYNAWQKTRDEKFLTAFENIWKYIAAKIVDHRSGGEWLHGRDPIGDVLKRDVVELWKASYHNGRCCFELYERINE